MRVTVTSSINEMRQLQVDWDDLSLHALEPNAFYDSWLLLPALEHLRKESVQFVLVWDDEHLSGRPRLAGLFPLVRNFGYRGVPVPYFSMWRHKHCFLTTPLLRLDCAQTALLAFLNHLDRKTPGGCLMKFDFISGDGPFYEYLRRYSIEHNRLLDENMAQERPAMCANAPFDEYIKLRMSHKSYQKFMRKLKHLEDMGEITYEKLDPDADAGPWVQDFLNIEQSGWKGKEGSALASNPADRGFFEDACRGAQKSGRLELTRLCLGGRPIAMRTAYRSGNCLFAFKIAYDETLGKHSPGVLLDFENMRALLPEKNLMVDSCADPDHPVLSVIWGERRVIRSVDLSISTMLSVPVMRGIKLLRTMYHGFTRRDAAKRAALSTNPKEKEIN